MRQRSVKIVYHDGEQGTRALRGIRYVIDGGILTLFRQDGTQAVFNMSIVIKITEE